MNIFSTLKVYAEKWSVKSERAFTADEIAAVSSAKVVDSKYGNSILFMMKGGGQTFIPLDVNSNLTVGTDVDISKAKLVTLGREGEADIYRVSVD